jgi:ElaB/YqjD/DUF883 family membrane-anchored ribosome-binding protein
MAATTTANDPTNTMRSDAAREAVNRIADAASETVDRWSANAEDAVERASDAASDYANRAANAASGYAGRLTYRGERLIEDTRDYIGAHPLRTVGIAAAAGFLIGRLMR